MPTHVHLVAKPLCDGLYDQESSERRASCRTEGLAIYLRCRPNVGRSGTSPALAPKDHCPDKQGGAKWHFFALQTSRPPATPSVRRAPRAKCPFALQTARSPATPPVRRAPRAKCPFALLVYPDSSLWGRRWLMKGGALDRTIGRFPEPERRWPTRCHRVVERLSTFG